MLAHSQCYISMKHDPSLMTSVTDSFQDLEVALTHISAQSDVTILTLMII